MKYPFYLLLSLIIASCSSKPEFKKNPVDDIIKELNTEQEFSIILYDMEEKGSWSKEYYHQYQIITTKNPDSNEPEVVERKTDFMQVSESYFERNIENMGMEIVSKKDGKVNKTASPAGYANYVGDERYGRWKTGSDGNSFWEFYGKYAFMSSMFRMFTYPVYRSYYNDWGGYYRSGRPYYGPVTSGRSYYGTSGSYNTNRNTRYSNSFRNRVNSRTSRSSSRSTRSGSRYNSRSSSRSRSGGFGK